MPTDAFDQWTNAYKKNIAAGTELLWPSETLIRLFKGDYIKGLNKNYAGKAALDISFGGANNLIFLASLGLRVSGTEVTEEICALGRKALLPYGYEGDLRVGTNRRLPFEDESFDYLVSWNVIHYEDNEADMRRAIAEYSRVLKKGGRFFISTTGPEHKILKDSLSPGKHLYRIGRTDDFRCGQTFFYFDSEEYIRHYFGEEFRDISVGRTHDHLMTETLDWWIVSGVK